eukprot:SAG31_NODE_1239_length_9169_cov_18.922492_3_plen_83_part_00
MFESDSSRKPHVLFTLHLHTRLVVCLYGDQQDLTHSQRPNHDSFDRIVRGQAIGHVAEPCHGRAQQGNPWHNTATEQQRSWH